MKKLHSILLFALLVSQTSADEASCRAVAKREYPEDYSMQKFTYNQQLSAKTYMNSLPEDIAKKKSLREYPSDFVMRKFTYDEALE